MVETAFGGAAAEVDADKTRLPLADGVYHGMLSYSDIGVASGETSGESGIDVGVEVGVGVDEEYIAGGGKGENGTTMGVDVGEDVATGVISTGCSTRLSKHA